MPDSNKKKRQAVVVIHGIGEQRPMNTLRGFVTSLLNFEKSFHKDSAAQLKERTFWTKPDRVNDSYELRKISSRGRTDVRSTTHFYEYHWATNMRDTTFHHVIIWFRSLMWSIPFKAHARIIVLWFILWISLLIWGVAVLQAGFKIIEYFHGHNPSWSMFEVVIISIPLGLGLFSGVMVYYIGDAARYLRVDVNNIAQREAIRKNGVDLLKALHKTNDYDRIVLVGHSLGSVIAYDIITYLWIDFNKSILLNKDIDFEVNKKNSWGFDFGSLKYGDPDINELSELSDKLILAPDDPSLKKQMQEVQGKLWLKVNNGRKGWLISDLVTLGSPLAHANILMADNEHDFLLRQEEREYPTCPPVKDGTNYSYLNGDGKRYLHHATPFAVVRWSNLYYAGDFIGGRVSTLFGNGISDIIVAYENNRLLKFISRISPFTHSNYWMDGSTPDEIKETKQYACIEQLYKAMRLNDIKEGIFKS